MKISEALKYIVSQVKCLTVGHSCPLTFKADKNICKIKLQKFGSNWENTPTEFLYKYEKDGWKKYTIGTWITLDSYDIVQFCGKQSNFSQTQFNYFQFIIQSDGDVKVYGNVMSLVNFSTNILHDFQFAKLFNDCRNIISAPVLPAKHLMPACYFSMFRNCFKLKEAPILPATILKQFCYAAMFQSCVSIETMPTLRATKLKAFCYLAMFQQCSNLSKNIVLPAKQLVRGCYIQMFLGCSLITEMSTSFKDWNENGESTYYWVYDVVPGGYPRKGIFKCSRDIGRNIKYANDFNDYRYIPPKYQVQSSYGFFTYFQEKFLGLMDIITIVETSSGHLSLDLKEKISYTYISDNCRLKMGLK